MAKKKKLWIAAVALILVAAVIAAVCLTPKTPQQEVKVYSYSMVGYTNFYTGGSESYGVVTTDRVQTAYVSDTQQVTEIKVYQGQQVKKGDVLYLYDTTLSDLELDRKELSIEQMELNLETAKAELKALKAMKPMVLRDQPTTNTTTDNTKIPAKAVEGKIYNADSGKGTQVRPYYVWLKTGTRVTEEMIGGYLANRNPVYVVFRIASRAGGTFTDEYGVCYQMTEKPIEGTGGSIATASEEPPVLNAEAGQTDPSEESTEPTETTVAAEPTTEATEPTTEATEPTTESTEPTTEATEPTTAPTDPTTEPTEPTTEATEPTEPETEEVLQMFFFTPGTVQQETAGDEIIWNSGYTSSELQTMRTEKEAEIADLQFSIKMGKAELEIMKKEADNGMVVAQFDGIVTSVLEPENAMELDAPMIKLAGGGGFYVEGSVSELDLSTIEVGQKVTVTSWDTYMTYEGTITEVGTYPSEEEGNFSYGTAAASFYPYKVFIDETADLQEGYYVSLTYQSQSGSEEGIMCLENAFLRTENGESFVYVQGAEGLLEKRVVQTGENDGYSTQILSGLSESDYIAFPYGNEVKEGAPTVEGTWEDLYGY